MDQWGHKPQTSRELHGGTERRSYTLRVSDSLVHSTAMKFKDLNITDYSKDAISHSFLRLLFMHRLINTLQPGSVRKISNSPQNWHQVKNITFSCVSGVWLFSSGPAGGADTVTSDLHGKSKEMSPVFCVYPHVKLLEELHSHM